MLLLTLKQMDGMSQGRSWLRSQVILLQQALASSGLQITADGYFGTGTASLLKDFQKRVGLQADGMADKSTWDQLMPYLEQTEGAFWASIREKMQAFEGDLGFIHLWEGYVGKPYWPGGDSGVTLDPGVDLGYASDQVLANYSDLFTAEQWAAVTKTRGLRGEQASAALTANQVLASIRMSDQQALLLLPATASPYWSDISARFSVLKQKNTPGSVQTALLSLAYNRGAANQGLNVLAEPLANGAWAQVGQAICEMQQNNALAGIRARREAEGKLILTEMGLA